MLEHVWCDEAELFDLLTQLARCLSATSRSLRDFFADPTSRSGRASAIEGLAREADAVRRRLVVRIDTTFIATLDRQEIRRIGVALGAEIDWIAGTARLGVAFRATELQERAVRLAEILRQSSEQLEAGVSVLRKNGDALQHCVTVKRLEEEGDAVYRDALTSLFAERPEVFEVLKWKELYDRVEEALDNNARVAHLVESLAVGAR
jgi:uncharacterized protein Yka (UPF0111/DUF47 family)